MRGLRLYIILFFGIMLVPLAGVVTVNSIGFLVHRKTPSSDILNHQIARLEQSKAADLVLLGDSTLNAAIDEQLFAELTGHSVQSFALTGLWGYAGSLALLERLIDRRPPAAVLLMHTSDMLGRETADFGYFLASDQAAPQLLTDPDVMIAVKDNLTSAQNFKKWYKNWRRRMKKSGELEWPFLPKDAAPAVQAASSDAQGPSIRDELFDSLDLGHFKRKYMSLGHLNREKVKYLERLGTLCRDHELRCFYAHGPIASPFLEDVHRFHQVANPIIEGLGFDLLPATPVALTYDEVGDAEDHVAPDAKAAFTCRFAEFLLPYLDKKTRAGEEKALPFLSCPRERRHDMTLSKHFGQ
jgi:hypothetical protein